MSGEGQLPDRADRLVKMAWHHLHQVARIGLRQLLRRPIVDLLATRHIAPEGYAIDPQAAAFVRISNVMPTYDSTGVGGARRSMDLTAPIVDVPRDESVTIEDHRAPSGSAVRCYTPRNARPGLLVYFHGGGFTLGSLASHDGFLRFLSARSRVRIAAVDYRLAPEHRFPAPLDDALAAFRFAAEALGADPARIAVGGDSAGGTISAVIAQETRGDRVRPCFQLLIYPATDLTRVMPSHRHFATGLFLTQTMIDWFMAQYLNNPGEVHDPRVSPLFAKELRAVAPALVITAGFDPLRRAEGQVHGFVLFGGVIDEARREIERIADDLGRALA